MLKRVLHTGVEVDDLEMAVELYKSLGFEIHNRFEKPEPKASVVTVKKGETAFELWRFYDKKHPYVAYIRSHVAMYSDNLETDVQSMIDKGYKLVIPITDGIIFRYAFVWDEAGACYEIATEKPA
jgi:catechol 2,3-dioxygenase-like lactoylglutathione lyase family enzyme